MRKIPFARVELTSQRVRGLRGTSELPGRPATIYIFTCIGIYFVCDSASEFGAIGSTSFLVFSYPNLLLVFLNLFFLEPVSYFSPKCWDFLWFFFISYRYFSVPYFGLACDHGNSFLCLEEYEREGYWIEVRTFLNVKTTTTATTMVTCQGSTRSELS